MKKTILFLFVTLSAIAQSPKPIPQNNVAGLVSALAGKVPVGRTLTINGTTFDMSANRTFTVATGALMPVDYTQTGTLIDDGGGSLNNSASVNSAKVFDGNAATWYDANGNGAGKYVGRNMGTAVFLSQINITPRQDAQYGSQINGGQLQYSIDGTNWTTFYTVSGVVSSATIAPISVSFGPVSSQYWRLYWPSGGSYGNVAEMTLAYIPTGSSTAAALNAVSGDVVIPAGSPVATLATVNSTPGTFGSGNVIPVVTTNAKGLVTGTSSATITPATIGSISQKIYTLTATANGTVFTHNMATLYGYTTPTMTAVFYDSSGKPDYNVYATATTINSVTLVTPLLAGGGNETATGKLVIYVSQ